MNVIEDWYTNKYDEWSRLDRHKIEFEITKRYMDTYIPDAPLDILDIGGGPGRYSLYLAEKGHRVTLLDLSQHHIDIAKEKSCELGIPLVDYVKGDALELEAFPSEKYDVILLMGPLYHLTKEEDRRKAIEGAMRLLKKGGILITSFISRYAPMLDTFSYLEFDENEEEVKGLLHYLEDGYNEDGNGFTTAYFIGIEEAQSIMADYDLKQLVFAGVENILSCKEREIYALSKKDYDKCIELGYALSQDKNILGCSLHFLYIGQKSS
ncbi:MAG TPA: class I SAM-dependent methyltransferase [Mobilitalea sp.]|nr:class I SAM-dependent methyltransferase [Mobilitalea sp.]